MLCIPNPRNMVTAQLLNIGSELFGKKWRVIVIYSLLNGPKRFSEIKLAVPGCSVKVLSEVLDELTSRNILERKQYATIPVKVTYEITADAMPLVATIPLYMIKLEVFISKNTELFDFPIRPIKLLT